MPSVAQLRGSHLNIFSKTDKKWPIVRHKNGPEGGSRGLPTSTKTKQHPDLLVPLIHKMKICHSCRLLKQWKTNLCSVPLSGCSVNQLVLLGKQVFRPRVSLFVPYFHVMSLGISLTLQRPHGCCLDDEDLSLTLWTCSVDLEGELFSIKLFAHP